MAYNHTAISSINLKESEDFYVYIGFTRLREWKKPAENLEAIVMVRDEFILEIVYSPTNSILPLPDLIERHHIGFSVDDLSDIVSRLEKEGIKVLKPITKGVSVKEFAFVADPSGNIVELLVEN